MATNRRAQLLLPLLLLLLSISLCSICQAFEPERGTPETAQDERSPYVFDAKSFETWSENEHGRFRVLERFGKRSKLWQGNVDNYRVAILEADTRTFILPSHWDAEEVFYVRGGRGTITLVNNGNRESHEIQRGDIMVVPSGTVVYAVNNDEDEKLSIVMIVNPISLPGRFKEFYVAGGRNPESFYKRFSTDILEAALNAPREKLERLFGQQGQGTIVEASEKQIRALSQHSSHSEGWPFEHSPNTPFNLLRKKPSHSNDHGQLREVDANDYRQLQGLDIDVSLAKINSGSMMAPNYNSKATKLALVVHGKGEFEMVTPRSAEGGEGEHYRKVRSGLSRDDLIVIPPGHPVVLVASETECLQVLCFGINAANNKKFYLAGKNGIVNEMEREAQELAFGSPVAEVKEVFGAQQESIFLPLKLQQQREERAERDPNFVDF